MMVNYLDLISVSGLKLIAMFIHQQIIARCSQALQKRIKEQREQKLLVIQRHPLLVSFLLLILLLFFLFQRCPMALKCST